MTQTEALKLALEALEYRGTDSWRKRQPAITAIKAALEAKDEPWSPVSIGVDVTKEGTHVIAMRLRPNGVNEVIYSQFHPLAQQEAKDKPVAWYRDEDGIRIYYESKVWDDATPLYTTTSQRKPLTDDEIKEAVLDDPFGGLALLSMMREEVMIADVRQAINRIARAIEAAHNIKGEA